MWETKDTHSAKILKKTSLTDLIPILNTFTAKNIHTPEDQTVAEMYLAEALASKRL